MKISPEVAKAIAEHRPVVALETTIVSHGMPYPQNVECALAVEKIIRENGAVPATIGIVDGEPVVGLTPEQIEQFATRTGVLKVSKRDLPIAAYTHSWGATTVAATMILAAQAGIRFFVTGGIGGVQRGWETTLDISADLKELGRTPVTVICAGAKAILDIPATMEVLETEGVPVIGLNTDYVPGFYVPKTSCKVDYNAKTPEEAAGILAAKKTSGWTGGTLITDPVPADKALDQKRMDQAIDQALEEMEKAGVKGKDETPFLLKRIVELTGGDSLRTNIALIEHNAADGARIAVEYFKMLKEQA